MPSRRDVLKKAAYAGPAILTLPALPSLAQQGSGGAIDCFPLFDINTGEPLPGVTDEQIEICSQLFPGS